MKNTFGLIALLVAGVLLTGCSSTDTPVVGDIENSGLATTNYTKEDLSAAEAAIVNVVENEWNIKIESLSISYAGDDTSSQNLTYCQSLNPDVQECIVFTSNFHIPEQDTQMAWAFEPDSDISWYGWYVGKNSAGEWEVLTNGFG